MINAPSLQSSTSTLNSIRNANARELIEQEYERTLEAICDLIYQTSLSIEQHNQFSDKKAMSLFSPEQYENIMVNLVTSVSDKLQEIKTQSFFHSDELCAESPESEEKFLQLLNNSKNQMQLVRWHAEETIRLYSIGSLEKCKQKKRDSLSKIPLYEMPARILRPNSPTNLHQKTPAV